jgi:hypothetical protein
MRTKTRGPVRQRHPQFVEVRRQQVQRIAPLRVGHARVVAVAQWDPKVQREWPRGARAYLRRNVAHPGAIEMMHTERPQAALLADRDHQVHRRQSAAEGSLDDGSVELQAPTHRRVFPHARKSKLMGTA